MASAGSLHAGSGARLRCSVIVAAHNRARYVANLLETLARQDCPLGTFEAIVVDDGSTDGTSALVSSLALPYETTCIRKPHESNRGRTRNLGVLQARGDVVIFVDADMLCPPGFVRAHLELHDRCGPCAVSAWHQRLREPVGYPLPDDWEQRAQAAADTCFAPGVSLYTDGPPFITANASCRRLDALEVGLFDEWFTGYGYEDLDLGYRLHLLGRRFVSDRSTMAYHQPHPDSPTKGAEGSRNLHHYRRKNFAPRRVLHLLGWMVAGGVERFVLQLCRGLKDHQHLMTSAVVREPEFFQDEFPALGVQVWHLAPDELGTYLAAHPADILHVHCPHEWMPAVTRWRGTTAVVVTLHGVFGMLNPPPPSRVALVASGQLQRQPEPHERYRLIHAGVDLDEFRPRGVGDAMRARLGIPPQAFVVGSAGRFGMDKFSLRMAAVYLEVLSALPDLYVLLLGQGPLMADYQAMAAERGVRQRLLTPGPVRDVGGYMEAMDLSVHATEREAFGTANVEAMAMGLPVVAPRLSGPLETIVDGETGFLCDSLGEMIARTIECATGHHDLTSMGRAARRRACEFSYRRTALRYKLLYDEVLDGAQYWWPPHPPVPAGQLKALSPGA
ncbi:MAG: glycosyltransferase [Armatimonadetes bacterium]|nr:glycosyltransferase [Armatimonadota bacterium]